MSQFLCVTVRFLQPFSHGRGDDAEPEWPPSPLRLFQALVAAAAARWNERQRIAYAQTALQWLAELGTPVVLAAQGTPALTKYRLYVPDNVADKVAKSWSGGNSSASIADYRTEKDVRPVHLNGEAVHYLFSVSDPAACQAHFETLRTAARSITHLGWGVDMVAGNAELLSDAEAAKLVGERWEPTPDGSGTRLRVPTSGTLSALISKHEAFLNRLSGDGFRPVPPLTAFATVGYRRDTDSAPRPVVAFELHKPVAVLAEQLASASKFRPFDPVRAPGFARNNGGEHHPCGAVVVAGLVRHLAAVVCGEQGWEKTRVDSFVLGHGDQKDGQATTDDRLQFLPLPSITPLKVESIRRVLIAGPPGSDLAVFQRLLNGRELFAEGHTEPVAMLSIASRADTAIEPYLRSSCVWSTVTPVVLPGFDDASGTRKKLSARTAEGGFASGSAKNEAVERLDAEVRKLLLRAFAHAGVASGLLSAELLERGEAGLEWREVGFRAGVGRSREYRLGAKPGYPRYHVRVRFARAVNGPLCVGNGRYRGLGLFAAE